MYFYIAENNQKFYLLCASTQNYSYQEQLLLLHYFNKITLWLTLHLIVVLITYQLINCDSFHPFRKQNFSAGLRNMEKNGCAEMYTSGIHVAARFITLHQFWTLVGMNPLWWIVLWKNDFVWNIFCGAADICQQHKKKPTHACVLKSASTFITLKEVTWSQVAIREWQDKRNAVPLEQNW